MKIDYRNRSMPAKPTYRSMGYVIVAALKWKRKRKGEEG